MSEISTCAWGGGGGVRKIYMPTKLGGIDGIDPYCLCDNEAYYTQVNNSWNIFFSNKTKGKSEARLGWSEAL